LRFGVPLRQAENGFGYLAPGSPVYHILKAPCTKGQRGAHQPGTARTVWSVAALQEPNGETPTGAASVEETPAGRVISQALTVRTPCLWRFTPAKEKT